MRVAFAGHVFDADRRELWRGDQRVAVQPQVFALLEYLIARRDRAVSKDELLTALWPDAEVTEGSLQRTVSLARAALAGVDAIRTYPRHGYRFVAEVAAAEAAIAAAVVPPPRYARRGDVHLAWRALGGGDVDLVVVPGWAFPMSAWFELPAARAACDRLAALGRLILFDKRGVGLSDPIKHAPGLEERMEDLRAVLDAAGSTRAIVVGVSEGAPMALLYAATYPERVRGLALVGAFARMSAAEGYPWGWSPARIEGLRAYIGERWGAGATVQAMVPRHAGEAAVVRWAAAAEQQGASPGGALDLVATNLAIDARAVVPMVRVPAVVLHHTDDAVIAVGNGRWLGEHLPRARVVEVPGDDHAFLFDGGDVLAGELRALIDRTGADDGAATVLTTALVAEVAVADAAAVLRRFGAEGAVVDGARIEACFDGPVRALRCAQALVADRGRAGVHIGEVVRDGPRRRGPALEMAARLAAAAGAGEVRASRVVPDLVGAALRFAEIDGDVDRSLVLVA